MSRNVIGTILGPKGCGKSTLVGEIVSAHPRVVVLDFVGEYGRKLGFEECWGFAECERALREASHAETFKLSLRDVHDQEREDVLELLFELDDHLLVIEEAGQVCGPGVMPDRLRTILTIGRHRRISQLYVAQRPTLVNRLVTSQSDWIAAFRQHEDRDVKFLVGAFGARMEGVRTLPDYALMLGGDVRKAPRAVRARARGATAPEK